MMQQNNAKRKSAFRITALLLTAVLLLLLAFSPKLATAFQTRVSYNEFTAQVKEGVIDEVDIDEASEKITYRVDGKTYYTNYPDYEEFKAELLKSDVAIKINEKSTVADMLPFLSLMIYLLLVLVLLRSMSPGGRYQIENSKTIRTRFDNVAGMEEIKKDLLFLADMMKDPAFKQSGARLPKGILLEGPPGNGKTLLARAFAGETGVNFIAVNASDFSSSLVGAGSSKVRNLFKKAKANKPCVIFIDEIDGVGSARSSDNSAAGREMNTIITALLNEMDGFDSADGIMVIAATNRENSLDEALVRPGRFDRRLVISYPDKKTRLALFALYTKNTKTDAGVSFDRLANRTYGCSCSEIETIVNEAILLSVKNRHSAITEEDFEQAILQMVIKGSVKEHANQSAKERRLTAYHEAGHAVAGHFLTHRALTTVTIKPTTSGMGGFTVTENKEDLNYITVQDIKNDIKVGYGGRAAEYLLGGKSLAAVSSGAGSDIQEVTRLALSCAALEKGMDFTVFPKQGEAALMQEAEKMLSIAWEETVSLLEEKWEYVEKTAALLIEKETLTSEEFEAVFP